MGRANAAGPDAGENHGELLLPDRRIPLLVVSAGLADQVAEGVVVRFLRPRSESLSGGCPDRPAVAPEYSQSASRLIFRRTCRNLPASDNSRL